MSIDGLLQSISSCNLTQHIQAVLSSRDDPSAQFQFLSVVCIAAPNYQNLGNLQRKKISLGSQPKVRRPHIVEV